MPLASKWVASARHMFARNTITRSRPPTGSVTAESGHIARCGREGPQAGNSAPGVANRYGWLVGVTASRVTVGLDGDAHAPVPLTK